MVDMLVVFLRILLAVLIFYIVFLGGNFYFFNIPFVIIQGVGVLVIFWALLAKRIYKHIPHKKTAEHVYFIKEGPYEFIRHPIFTGLLLIISSYMQQYLTIGRILGFIVFVIVMLIIVKKDEEHTAKCFGHEYTDYQKRTKKLIPYLY